MQLTKASAALALVLFLFATSNVEAQTLTCLPDGPAPTGGDTDGDGIPNGSDTDSLNPDNACQDNDYDLINELREYQLGTDPLEADTDGDGVPDGAEDLSGMNPLSVDALVDTDGDGFLNVHEAIAGTDATLSGSTPPSPASLAVGDYIFAVANGPNESWWFRSVYTAFEVQANDRIEIFPGVLDGSRRTGDYSETANHAIITYDTDTLIRQDFPFDPNQGIQVEELTYAVTDYLFPVVLSDGTDGVAIFSESRIEVVETASVSTAYNISEEYRVRDLTTLGSLTTGAGDYTLTVPDIPNFGGGTFGPAFLESHVTLNANGTGTRVLDSETFAWSLSGGVLSLNYGAGGVTEYTLVEQFGEFQWLAAVHTLANGTAYSAGHTHLIDETPNWPLPADQGLQYAVEYPATPFTLNILDDGTTDYLLYSVADGDWVPGTSWLWQWSFVGQSIVMQRFIFGDGSIAVHPDDCIGQTCFVAWQREQHPMAVRENGDVVYYWELYRIYQWSDSNQDGTVDTQTLDRTLARTRKAYRTENDLDVDGIDDTVDTDDDGDSLPDAWERAYTMATQFADADDFFFRFDGDSDPDRDRLINSVEYALGTDPLTPDEVNTSLVLRRTTDQRWFSYQFQFGDIVDQGPLAGLTRNPAYTVVSRADFDGDGQADVLVRDLTPNREQNGRWVLYTLDGGNVTSQGFLTDGVTRNSDWELISDGDFDGDGLADLLLRNSNDGRWLLYLMDERSIKTQSLMSLSEELTDEIQGDGDFNGDGKTDILIRTENGVWLVYEFDGINPVNPGTPALTTNLQFSLQALDDFNGDDKTDVLVRRNDGRWFMYLMDGADGSPTSASPNLTEATAFELATTADFDGDGSSDILLRRNSDGRWFMYTMSGTSVATSGPVDLTRNLAFQIVSTEDYSYSGSADLLMRRDDGRWVLYTLDGTTVEDTRAPDMTRNTAWIPYVE